VLLWKSKNKNKCRNRKKSKNNNKRSVSSMGRGSKKRQRSSGGGEGGVTDNQSNVAKGLLPDEGSNVAKGLLPGELQRFIAVTGGYKQQDELVYEHYEGMCKEQLAAKLKSHKCVVICRAGPKPGVAAATTSSATTSAPATVRDVCNGVSAPIWGGGGLEDGLFWRSPPTTPELPSHHAMQAVAAYGEQFLAGQSTNPSYAQALEGLDKEDSQKHRQPVGYTENGLCIAYPMCGHNRGKTVDPHCRGYNLGAHILDKMKNFPPGGDKVMGMVNPCYGELVDATGDLSTGPTVWSSPFTSVHTDYGNENFVGAVGWVTGSKPGAEVKQVILVLVQQL
jgi:hypothetical protein